MARFRIRDLLQDRTLIESDRGRDLSRTTTSTSGVATATGSGSTGRGTAGQRFRARSDVRGERSLPPESGDRLSRESLAPDSHAVRIVA